MPLHPQARFVLEQLAALGGPQLHEMEPADARKAFESMRPPTVPEPVAHVEERAVPGPAGEVPVRLYVPEGAETPGAALVYFHGGGWVIGSPDTHDGLCRALANRAGVRVVSVDYRLAPEHRFPAAAEDCYAVTRHLAAHGDAFGIDGERLAVGGDSAGGNLAAAVALMARDRGAPVVRHQLLIYPVTDWDFERPSYRELAEGYFLTRDGMRWFWGHYAPEPEHRASPYAAPLRAESLAGLPPATVVTAEYDPLRDEGEAYAARLADAGVPVECTRYDGMIHGFASMLELFDDARRATARLAEILRAGL